MDFLLMMKIVWNLNLIITESEGAARYGKADRFNMVNMIWC